MQFKLNCSVYVRVAATRSSRSSYSIERDCPRNVIGSRPSMYINVRKELLPDTFCEPAPQISSSCYSKVDEERPRSSGDAAHQFFFQCIRISYEISYENSYRSHVKSTRCAILIYTPKLLRS